VRRPPLDPRARQEGPRTAGPPGDSSPNDDLLARAAFGDGSAWAGLVHRYQRLVYAIIRDYALSVEDGEDVFQETFLRLHQHLGRVQSLDHLARWIALVTRRQCLDRTAAIHRARKVPGGHVRPQEPAAPDDEITRHQRQQAVREAIGILDPRCRMLLELLFFEQDRPDYAAAAELLGVPVGSVGPTRARCFGRLLRMLRQRGFFRGDEG
jgi:RNA polymerase sigma factor (sigma-70 family)